MFAKPLPRNRENLRSKEKKAPLPFQSANEMMDLVFDSNKLAQHPYAQRIRIGRQLGHLLKTGKLSTDEFTKWYEKVHDSSKPAAPEIELDPELSEILPAQKHNNAKQYSSLQIALVAAQEGEQI